MRPASIVTTILSLCAIATADASVESRQAAGLNVAIVSRGKSYVGTAMTWRNDNSERNIISNYNEFGSITPENALKWNTIEPNRGQFNYSAADRIVDFAVQNNKILRCHALIFGDQLPRWLTNNRYDNATLLSIMENHIRNVVGRYQGRCDTWDVVNQALNEDGSYKNNIFYQTIGENYIPLSFWAVNQVDPNVKLYYNDYNLEFNSAKTAGALRLVRLIKSYGIKIDGVGFEGHLTSESTPSQRAVTPAVDVLTASLRSFTDLGVDVAFSQVDIRMNTPSNQRKLDDQANTYSRVTQSCMRVSRCVGITFWGVSDKYSWVPDSFDDEGSALLWDNNFNKKPAYRAVLNAIVSG